VRKRPLVLLANVDGLAVDVALLVTKTGQVDLRRSGFIPGDPSATLLSFVSKSLMYFSAMACAWLPAQKERTQKHIFRTGGI